MNETPLFAQNRFLFLISRLLILGGMVLVFAGVSSLAGILVSMPFGVDIIHGFDEYIAKPELYPKQIFFIKLLQVFTSIGTFIIPAMLFPKALGKLPVIFLMVKRKSKWYFYLIAIFAILFSLPAVSSIYELNKSLTLPEKWHHIELYLKQMEERAELITKALTTSNNISQLILNTLVVAIVPAIAEELFFRGCLQNFVKMVFYNIHIAVILSAIIFSGFHGQYYGFLPRFMLGVVLGYLFAYSNNIWVSVTGHFINNFFALLSMYLYKLHPDWKFLADDYTFPFMIVAVCSLICITLIYFLSRLRFRSLKIYE